MKIATTTADFNSYVQATTDIKQILPMLAECGFKYIDVNFCSAINEDSPLCGEAWREWIDEIANEGIKLGLRFVQAHSPDSFYTQSDKSIYRTAMIKRQIEACQMLGIPGTVVHCLSRPDISRADFMDRNTEFYQELLEVSERTGVAIYTENSCTENSTGYYLVNAEQFHELNQHIGNHPLFGICWDVGHANVQKVDQYHEIVALGSNLKAVHIHDNTGKADMHQQLYSGNCQYDAIMKGLVDVGYDGYFTLESYAIPAPYTTMKRRPYTQNGEVYDKLCMLPLEFKMRAEKLTYDIVKYMLETYNCFEE